VAEPIALTDPAAREPEVVGVKAALLALAGAAGLPTLPGSVIPLEASAAAIEAGAGTLPRSGRAAAYLAATSADVPEGALAILRDVAPSVVVRSSTHLDDDGRWSGAFTSYHDVGPQELATAVRGCWSSVFSRDVLERCEAAGTDPGALRVGVLVQPWVAFDIGGTARVGPGEQVAVSSARGGPHRIVEGVGREDGMMPPEVAAAVESLALRVLEVTGVGVIEWGAVGADVMLLQVGPRPVDVVPATSTGPVHASAPPEVERAATVVAWFPGPLGEHLVVPWALGSETLPTAAPWDVADPMSALNDAEVLASELTAQAWPDGSERAALAIRALRTGAFDEAASTIRASREPDAERAAAVVALLRGVGEWLADAGVLPSAELVWQLSLDDLRDAARGRPPVLRRGPDRWEPVVADVVMARGRVLQAIPVAGGMGAGRLHRLDGLRSIGRPWPRAVLAAPLPLPQLAPLLWHCAGLVTAGGSEGAHLFEVARSLGVPAVIGVEGDELGEEGRVVAGDGAGGRVATLGAAAPAAVVNAGTAR
jgi:hypothetical protein